LAVEFSSQFTENLFMRPARTSGIGPVGAILLSLFALGDASLSSDAAQPTHEQLMAACRAKYGKNVADAVLHKNGSVTCKVQVIRQMTRAEAFEACRKKYGATTILLHKTKGGWVCRYYGRY
jgi:hypothetical protein